MRLEQFHKYLEETDIVVQPFSIEEIDEPLLTTYNILTWVLRDQCNIIEVSKDKVVWRKHDEAKYSGEFLTPVDFRPYFQLVVGRDIIVQEHLLVLEETTSVVTYRISQRIP